ncbi:MAG: DNA methylase [Oscillospiraceae bacterium]|nr:DNA methylase [Oscillospiraceae bacterium]
MQNRTYLCIDLKSFYASVECVERGLDPLNTNLVVADESRTEKTICLAVSPSLKAYGIPGRARLFEVVQKVSEVNASRRYRAPGHNFSGESYLASELSANPSLSLSYITAIPRMAYYIQYSTKIYEIYLKYISSEDIHVYSIDEVFMDLTEYLGMYKCSAHELAMRIIQDVLKTTGITATAGIGTNMYLAKIAMDIEAKHIPADKDGVRIAELDEMSYREKLWNHTPITDFWRVGKGYAKKLESHGMTTMGDVARFSVAKAGTYTGEDILYDLFGVNAELLIDHAWGWEPCTIADIKAYKPESNSLGSGQVLKSPYDFSKAKIVLREMIDALVLDLVDKGLVTDQIVLTIGFDTTSLFDSNYEGETTTDRYGRKIPKHAHGTANIEKKTSSSKLITEAVLSLYDRIVDRSLLIRRINVTANHVVSESFAEDSYEQIDFFSSKQESEKEKEAFEKEHSLQEAVLHIKKKYGKNAILKGTNFEEGATGRERNKQIGGHRE